MNKRQKKKLYKKLHGQNPPKIVDVQEKAQPQPQQKLEYNPLWKYAQESEDLATRFKDELQKAATTIGESLTTCAARVAAAMKTFSAVPDTINAAREYDEVQTYKRKYGGQQEIFFKLVFSDPEPPVVKTAKILTAQRLAGKRNRKHIRNRRNRKWDM